MPRLRLFTVFHGNLDFSAVPRADLPRVIERDYWPLLGLAESSRLPLGLEMPARTLARLADEDPEWVKTFRALAERGLVELVGSGWAQVIGPLVPADVNRDNLVFGLDAYREFLGQEPSTWFVNEQTFSRGMARHYQELGARALIMEWNNPATLRPAVRARRHRTASVDCGDGGGLPLLWNDSVLFQKLQRVAHGETPVHDYLDAVACASAPDEERLLCAYGGDLEIFDYRPGRPAPMRAEAGEEMARLCASLRALGADARFEFRLPRDAAEGYAPGPVLDLVSEAEPLPCKKQPRYNPTRWAVSGRGGLGMNTRCFALRQLREAAAVLAPEPARQESRRRALVQLWGSDFRTRATEEKVERFRDAMGAETTDLHRRLEAVVGFDAAREDVVLVNPSDEPWSGDPVEIPIRMAPGRMVRAAVVADPPSALPPDRHQVEIHTRYRDGSIRSGSLVLEPELGSRERISLRFAAGGPEPAAPGDDTELRTARVEAGFWNHRGGALAWLRFPELGGVPLVGTVPHGSFDDVAYTPDFYSGHLVAVTESGAKVTDLSPAHGEVLDPGPVRVTRRFRVRTSLGEWTKYYRVYHHHPRLDVVHALRFDEARLATLRLGVLTALPDAFERAALRFETVNGGTAVEHFPLGPGARVRHTEPVSLGVSARSCLGATEGWVSFGDARRGVAVIGDRAQAAVVPLVEFAEVDERFFLRVLHSAAETDETRVAFVRGFHRFGFALVGHPAELDGVRRTARCIERGLVYRTESDVGVARGV